MELPIDIIIRVDAKKENNSGEYTFQCKALGELVRCGECNRHEEPRDTGLKAFVWCNLYNTHKLKNGYCNCGERKDGEHERTD